MATPIRIGELSRTVPIQSSPTTTINQAGAYQGPSVGAAALDSIRQAIMMYMQLQASDKKEKLAQQQQAIENAQKQNELTSLDKYRQSESDSRAATLSHQNQVDTENRQWQVIQNSPGAQFPSDSSTITDLKKGPYAGFIQTDQTLPSKQSVGYWTPQPATPNQPQPMQGQSTPPSFSPGMTNATEAPSVDTGTSSIRPTESEMMRRSEATNQLKAQQDATRNAMGTRAEDERIRNNQENERTRALMAVIAQQNANTNQSNAGSLAQVRSAQADHLRAIATQMSTGVKPEVAARLMMEASKPRGVLERVNPPDAVTIYQRYIEMLQGVSGGLSTPPPPAAPSHTPSLPPGVEFLGKQ